MSRKSKLPYSPYGLTARTQWDPNAKHYVQDVDPLNPSLPKQNLIRVWRATGCFIVCLVCLAYAVFTTMIHYDLQVLFLTLVVIVQCLWSWLARVVYGWFEVTRKRKRQARWLKAAPFLTFVLSIVIVLLMPSFGIQGHGTWVTITFYMVFASATAAGIAVFGPLLRGSWR